MKNNKSKLERTMNLYFISSIILCVILIIGVFFYFSELQNYKNLNFISITNKFHKQNSYDINTNNCMHQAINLQEVLESEGYEVGLIEFYDNDLLKAGHLIDSITIYIDPTSNMVMNKKQLIEKYKKDYNIENMKNINNTERLDYILSYGGTK